MSNDSEEYNGTSWTNGGNINTARTALGGAGTQTAGMIFGGEAPGRRDETETYDGSTWTEVGDLNTARYYLAGFGIQTAALAAGGNTNTSPVAAVITENYDGSTWAEVADLSTARERLHGGGTNQSGVVMGGYVYSPSEANTNASEEWSMVASKETVAFD